MRMEKLLEIVQSSLVGPGPPGHTRDQHLTNTNGVARLLVTSIQMALIENEGKLDIRCKEIDEVRSRTARYVMELAFCKEVVGCLIDMHNICIDNGIMEGCIKL